MDKMTEVFFDAFKDEAQALVHQKILNAADASSIASAFARIAAQVSLESVRSDEVEVCCQDFATCRRPCTPRGIELGKSIQKSADKYAFDQESVRSEALEDQMRSFRQGFRDALEMAAQAAEAEPLPGPDMPEEALRFTRYEIADAATLAAIKGIARRIRALQSPARVAEQKDVHSTELRK